MTTDPDDYATTADTPEMVGPTPDAPCGVTSLCFTASTVPTRHCRSISTRSRAPGASTIEVVEMRRTVESYSRSSSNTGRWLTDGRSARDTSGMVAVEAEQ